MKQTVVTTSWDDGHKLDIRLARLLKKYGIKATFYISPLDHEYKKEDLLSKNEIKSLAKDFEIGAHTMTHPHLSKISLESADYEIRESKKYLEKVIGREVTSFCYPYGDYNQNVAELVSKYNFKLARTIKRFSFEKPTKPFEMGTTFHSYKHYSEIPRIFTYTKVNILTLAKYTNWENSAKDLFDYAYKNNFLFHLWGHAIEFEKFNEWDKLENLLDYISRRKNVVYKTNGEIIK
jgi:peptidoglycan/xylan/chitin deacetylase (PgdA/CDA1 family)